MQCFCRICTRLFIAFRHLKMGKLFQIWWMVSIKINGDYRIKSDEILHNFKTKRIRLVTWQHINCVFEYIFSEFLICVYSKIRKKYKFCNNFFVRCRTYHISKIGVRNFVRNNHNLIDVILSDLNIFLVAKHFLSSSKLFFEYVVKYLSHFE